MPVAMRIILEGLDKTGAHVLFLRCVMDNDDVSMLAFMIMVNQSYIVNINHI